MSFRFTPCHCLLATPESDYQEEHKHKHVTQFGHPYLAVRSPSSGLSNPCQGIGIRPSVPALRPDNARHFSLELQMGGRAQDGRVGFDSYGSLFDSKPCLCAGHVFWAAGVLDQLRSGSWCTHQKDGGTACAFRFAHSWSVAPKFACCDTVVQVRTGEVVVGLLGNLVLFFLFHKKRS